MRYITYIKKIIPVFLLLVFVQAAKGQDFEWASDINIKSQTVNHVTDPDGNSYVIATQLGGVPYPPGKIGDIPSPDYPTGYWSYLAKYNTSGQLCWVKWMFNLQTWKIASDNKGRLYVSFVVCCDSFDFITLPNDYKYANKYSPHGINFHIMKLDTTGTVTGVKPTGIQVFNIKCVNDKLFLVGTVHYLSDVSFNYDGISRSLYKNRLDFNTLVIIRADTSMNLELYKQVESIGSAWNAVAVDKSGAIYFGATFRDSIYYDNVLYRHPVQAGKNSAVLVKFSPSGAVEWEKIFYGSVAGIHCMAVDNNDNIYVAGRLSMYGNVGSNFVDTGCFVQAYTPGGDFKWEKKIEGEGFNGGRASVNFITAMELINNFIYFTCEAGVTAGVGQTAALIFGPTKVTATSRVICMSKLDTAGYYLYTFHARKEGYTSFVSWYSGGLGGDLLGNMYVSGDFAPEVVFGPHTLKILYDTGVRFNFEPEAFIVKIKDMSISRGPISSGPYCSGDSIQVPFIINGNFAADNEFIAELSDTNGKFDNPSVLGRLAGNLNGKREGIIMGYIPKYNFIGSDKYRVRIFATKPVVSSFYIDDPLRIRVYSSDTANAGPDTAVCYGKTINLTTFGGTRVVWSAAPYTDSTVVRDYAARPDSTTEYRVIISDTSGCGVTDTDYVKVSLPPSLDISIKDTVIVCTADTATIVANCSGGDSTKYKVEWYDSAMQQLHTGKTFSVQVFKPRIYYAVLTDGCARNDTAQVYVSPDKNLQVVLSPDTIICYGQSYTINSTAVFCKPGLVKYVWDNGLGEGNSKTVSPLATTTYTIIGADTLGIAIDTAEVTVTVRPGLTIKVNNDTTLCSGDSMNFSATASGGLPAMHSIVWKEISGAFTSDKFNFTHTPQATSKYMATLDDACSLPATDSFLVTVVQNPLASFITDTTNGCPPLTVHFTNTSSFHDSVFNKWIINDVILASNTETFSYTFNYAGQYGAGLKVGNVFGCKDSVYNNRLITVFEKPEAVFEIKPEIKEVEKPIYIFNQSRRATAYVWDFGDNNSIVQNSLRDTIFNYADTGIYTISLIAQNARGCTDTATETVKIHDRMTCIIPNAFTPNRDDLNSVFAPVCSGLQSYTLTIYNRWGQILSQCENCAWNGNHDGYPVAQGIYMYKLQIQAATGRKETLSGLVNVLR